MPILLRDIKIGLDMGERDAVLRALALLKLKQSEVKETNVVKVSVDARHKGDIKLVYTISVSLYGGEKDLIQKLNLSNATYKEETEYYIPEIDKKTDYRPVIVGFGPAGMFAGLYLARAGARPIIIERGSAVDDRAKATEAYWAGGSFSPKANVQFGEGGAGTFSDGKLTTRINDPRCDFVIGEFVKHGAPKEILTKAKPHIGTDILRNIVKSIREEILSLGGEIHFEEALTDLEIKDGKVISVSFAGEKLFSGAVILAIGHSARDTFSMLAQKGIIMTAKPFSVGVRIEQLQSVIDSSLYGALAGHPALSHAEYQLSLRNNDRCVYTFCMCPGGVVVPSESMDETIVTNGMSYFLRNKDNANSALVCSVSAEDFDNDPFKALAFQEKIERKAYLIGKGKAVAQTVGAFLNGGESKFSSVTPTYARGVYDADIKSLFPECVNSMLELGLKTFNRRIERFSSNEAVITAPETRTSSPIRILRDDSMQAVGVKGLYPVAEGAGYAGGIMSAAVDGLKAAELVADKLIKMNID